MVSILINTGTANHHDQSASLIAISTTEGVLSLCRGPKGVKEKASHPIAIKHKPVQTHKNMSKTDDQGSVSLTSGLITQSGLFTKPHREFRI